MVLVEAKDYDVVIRSIVKMYKLLIDDRPIAASAWYRRPDTGEDSVFRGSDPVSVRKQAEDDLKGNIANGAFTLDDFGDINVRPVRPEDV